MAKKKMTQKDLDRDEIEALKRYVDQPGQVIDTTPPEVKAKQQKYWDLLAKRFPETVDGLNTQKTAKKKPTGKTKKSR